MWRRYRRGGRERVSIIASGEEGGNQGKAHEGGRSAMGGYRRGGRRWRGGARGIRSGGNGMKRERDKATARNVAGAKATWGVRRKWIISHPNWGVKVDGDHRVAAPAYAGALNHGHGHEDERGHSRSTTVQEQEAGQARTRTTMSDGISVHEARKRAQGEELSPSNTTTRWCLHEEAARPTLPPCRCATAHAGSGRSRP